VEIGEGPFRGSEAVAAGLLTPNHLRGPRFRRLYPDVYVRSGDREPDLLLRSRAAYRYVEGFGVLGGWSAATLLEAPCAPADAVPEVVVEHDVRNRPDLLVRRGVVERGDRHWVGDCLVTSPLVTAWDLARRLDLVEAVVAVDALARVGAPGRAPFRPEALLGLRTQRPGARGSRSLDEVVRLADPRAGSPPETRMRLALTFAGIPPQVQYPIRDRFGRMTFDLAYPEALLGIEYDGEVHRSLGYDDRRRDLRAGALGWHVMRFGASAVSVTTDEAVHLITAQRLQRLSIMTPSWSQA
jgi:Protein of unknown function (DUF559)